MLVEIQHGVAMVREAADLKGLAVRVDAPDSLLAALHGLGEPASDGTHVWLHIDALKVAASATLPAAARVDWENGFDGMIAYAASKGWTSDDGSSVRAHVDLSRRT